MSVQAEDYIKNIYMLQEDSVGERVTTSSLADALSISSASVTDMVKKLSERSLIKYTPYQGVELTQIGKKMALRTIRRHRLWEMFLVEFLNYTWDAVHKEAEKLEHVTSEDLVERIDLALGYPKRDPHGHPIPTRDGKVGKDTHPPLANLQLGAKGKIIRVNDNSPDLLKHISKLGIKINSIVEVLEIIDFDGSMRLKIMNEEQFVSKMVARNIFIKVI